MSAGGLLAADWRVPANVRAFTTLRDGPGVSLAPFDRFNLGNRTAADGDDPGAVERNRRALAEAGALPSAPRWLRQVHGTRVAAEPGADEPEADAAVTAVPGNVLAILTADCLPVAFAAVSGNEAVAVGAAHAGWRGLAGGVLENTVAAMDARAQDVIAWLGPAAGPQAYEIGEEVFEAFVSQDARAEAAFASTRPGHWRVDLYALARQRLRAVGVERVHGGGLCTISDAARFYSHRRDRRTGRMATLVWMD
ncbi:peptidoglycan editing factor PgeF [Luteimonas aquatica]|uniref:peptidoglycan editing factor PgeF n=1 Tax=Luteimonas aquatica TaxID=450364 RepID=UPI001F55D075|nr:peptidoglycan editing factor PgeF [Luteimonas aquatica]